MKKFIIIAIVFALFFLPVNSFAQSSLESEITRGIENAAAVSKDMSNKGMILVFSNTSWSGSFPGSSNPLNSKTIEGSGNQQLLFGCESGYPFSAVVQKQTDWGYLLVSAVHNGKVHSTESTTSMFGVVSVSGMCESAGFGSGGGCLIATATFDSELSPQVQKLREIRDSKLLATESGSAFMESFNSFYYSFSPIIADYERENPVFKEMVKVGVTPLLSTLSLMDYAESEAEVLTIGIGVILLNLGMYVGVPVFAIMRIRK